MCCVIPLSMESSSSPYEVCSVVITKEIVIVKFVDKTKAPHQYKISYVEGNTIFCEGNTEISIDQRGRKKAKTIEQIHRRRKFALAFGIELNYISVEIICNNDYVPTKKEGTGLYKIEPVAYYKGEKVEVVAGKNEFLIVFANGCTVVVENDFDIIYKKP